MSYDPHQGTPYLPPLHSEPMPSLHDLRRKWPFAEMDVGDAFDIQWEPNISAKMSTRCAQWSRYHGHHGIRKFSVRTRFKDGRKVLTVWRVR